MGESARSTGALSDARLASLAILRINWDTQQQSWIDNFVPFVTECLRIPDAPSLEVGDVQRALGDQFGLNVPAGALRTILRRAVRRGLATQEDGRFAVVPDALVDDGLQRQRQDALRQQAALLDKLRQFASREYQRDLAREEAEQALLAYVEELALPLLRTMLGAATFEPAPQDQGDHYIVSAFIAGLVERDPQGFEYLETVVKGSMLASSLYLGDLGAVNQRFQQVTVYFDTPFLLDALGYAGKEIAQPALELLGLVRDLGARLACFGHTVTELQGVLGGIANGLRNPRRRAALTLSRVEEHFVHEGLGPSDIEVFLNTVERDLRTLGINLSPTPRYEEHLGVDELALEDLLQAEVGYQNQYARRHDLDALTAIWRLRHGQAQRRLETCRAIFVTTNAPLVRAARRFFAAGYDGFTWPLAVLDHDLATLAWLKRPLQAPDLPRKQIIADCYAALRPEGRLWARYLEEIEALRHRGELSNDHFVALRYSVDARRALMDTTLGDPEAISGTTVHAVLSATLGSIRSPLLEQLAAGETVREATEHEAQAAAGRADAAEERATLALRQASHANAALRAFRQAQVNRAKRKAAHWARRVEVAAFAVLTALVVGSAVASLAGSIQIPFIAVPPGLRWPPRILFVALLVVGAVLSVVSLVTGWSVKLGVSGLKHRLIARLESHYLDELPPEGSDGELS